MARQRIELHNDYHATSVTVTANIHESTVLTATLSDYSVARLQRTLCGYDDCTCGVIRGRQIITLDGLTYDWIGYGGSVNTLLYALIS